MRQACVRDAPKIAIKRLGLYKELWLMCWRNKTRSLDKKKNVRVWSASDEPHLTLVSLTPVYNLPSLGFGNECYTVLGEQYHLAQHTSLTTKHQSVCSFDCFILLAKMHNLRLCYYANNFFFAAIYLPDYHSLWCEFAPGSQRQSTKSFTTAASAP